MRDLVRLSNDDLQELTTGQRFRVIVAAVITVVCAVVALQGLAGVVTDAEISPLPGMQHAGGRIAWTAALILMLIAVTFLVRGVVKRRLQLGIALSLLIHLLLCLSMTAVEFQGTVVAAADAATRDDGFHEEFSVPDYASGDVPDPDSAWLQPVETPTPESEIRLERAQNDIAESQKEAAPDVTEPLPEKASLPERKETVQLNDRTESTAQREISAQMAIRAEAQMPEVAAAAEAGQATLQVIQDRQKTNSELPQTERTQVDNQSATPAFSANVPAVRRTEELQRLPEETTEVTLARSAPQLPTMMTQQLQVSVETAASAPAENTSSPRSDAAVAEPVMAPVRRRSAGIPSLSSAANAGGGQPDADSDTRPLSTATSGESAAAGIELTPVTTGGTAVLAGVRGTEPSARLSADSPAGTGLSSPPRSRPGAGAGQLPGSVSGGNAIGDLLTAGPQPTEGSGGGSSTLPGVGSSSGEGNAASGTATGNTSGGTGDTSLATRATGPRTGTLPRRSAGLPGGTGTPSLSGAPSSSGASVSQGAGETGFSFSNPSVRGATGTAGIGERRPAITSGEGLVALMKKSASGAGISADARIPDSLSMRNAIARRQAAQTLGGSDASEEAVERGLQWLVRMQHPDGNWSIHEFPAVEGANSPTKRGPGSFRSDSAATGLALLAFLGAGYTHESGEHRETVRRGMTWLLDRQKPDGDLFADETEFVWFYSHGIASIALCEAYGLTKDERLRLPAQQALNFIVASQHPEFGGWRYSPRTESDTSVSGWQLMALKSGEMAGLDVPSGAYEGVNRWLDSVHSQSTPGRFSYHPRREVSPAMTAEGLLMRQYLGARRDNSQLIAGARFLRTRLPDFGQRDAYYWYYATQVMFHMQGEYWSDWNASLRDLLVSAQTREGIDDGSWDPARPVQDAWSAAGGRHYLTCLNLLMLEVYYRHLPLYLELEK